MEPVEARLRASLEQALLEARARAAEEQARAVAEAVQAALAQEREQVAQARALRHARRRERSRARRRRRDPPRAPPAGPPGDLRPHPRGSVVPCLTSKASGAPPSDSNPSSSNSNATLADAALADGLRAAQNEAQAEGSGVQPQSPEGWEQPQYPEGWEDQFPEEAPHGEEEEQAAAAAVAAAWDPAYHWQEAEGGGSRSRGRRAPHPRTRRGEPGHSGPRLLSVPGSRIELCRLYNRGACPAGACYRGRPHLCSRCSGAHPAYLCATPEEQLPPEDGPQRSHR